MTYGTIKVDTVTFTDAGVDKSVTLSGLVQNPTFSGNVTVTGTLSGVTVTGTTANFTSGNFTNISGGTHTITSGVFAAGSAASPSITFTGDLNTGIYSPGADQVAISTNGAGRLSVQADGNVLIGATGSATRLLTVNQTGTTGGEYGICVSQQSATSNAIEITIDSVNGVSKLFQKSTVPLVFGTSDTERLRITSAGLVGIGTISPSASLSVAATTTSYTAQSFNIGEPSLSTGRQLYMGFHTTDGVGFIQPVHWGTEYKPLVLCPNGGRVGIGTTAPGATIDAIGDIRSLGRGTSFGFKTPDWRIYNTAGNALAFDNYTTEAFRIDAANRLLVGTSSARGNFSGTDTPQFQVEGTTYNTSTISVVSASATGGGNIELGGTGTGVVGNTGTVANNGYLGSIHFLGGNGTNLLKAAAIDCQVDGTVSGGGANDMPGRLVFSTTADGASSPTERMRIDSAGVLKVSNNSTYAAGGYHQFNQNASSQWALGVLGRNATDPYGIRVEYTNAAPNGTVSQFLYCVDTAGVKAEIRSNGGLANYSANNANLSDRNAKKDISPAADTWDCIKEWEIVNYRYKDQPDDADLNLGVIAQQVAESCPEVITVFQEATEDEPEKLGVKEQQMYWMAIKALQEAQARIETLEAKVAALESA